MVFGSSWAYLLFHCTSCKLSLFFDTWLLTDSISWNSTVFTTLQANQYHALLVARDFNTTDFVCHRETGCEDGQKLYDLARKPGQIEFLDTATCLKLYSNDFLTGRRNLLLVTNSTTATWTNGSLFEAGSIFGVMDSSLWTSRVDNDSSWRPEGWWCQSYGDSDGIVEPYLPPIGVGVSYSINLAPSWKSLVQDGLLRTNEIHCSLRIAMMEADSLAFEAKEIWNGNPSTPADTAIPWKIEYCLSQRVPESCQLGFSPYIMLIVVVCNIIKVACMVASLRALNDAPLVLIGDAIASFLEDPEKLTQGKCLMNGKDKSAYSRGPRGKRWRFTRYFWLQSPTFFSLSRCLIL